jgi:hypothetical protein
MTEQHARNARTTEGLVAELAEVVAEQERLAERRADLELILAAKLGAGTHEVGQLSVAVKPGSRLLDASKIEKAFPPEKRPELYKTETKLDTKAVRAHIAQVELDAYLKPAGKTSVSLK